MIVLVRSAGDDGVMMRLRADLRESGWRILEVRDDERFAAAPLGGVAEREGASAAVRIDTRRDAIELWVSRPDGPVEDTVASTEPLSDQVLALRGRGSTNLAGALHLAAQQLARSPAGRKITILLSDCRATEPGDVTGAARSLDELVIIAPEGDDEAARALAAEVGAPIATVAGPTGIPDALARVLT